MIKMYTLVVFALLAGGLTAQENASTGSTSATADAQPVSASQTTMRILLPPERTIPIPNFEASEEDPNSVIDLSNHFSDPGNPEATLTYGMAHISNPAVANATVDNQTLTIDYLAAGQTNIVITAEYDGQATADTFIVGVRPVIEGDHIVATFDDLALTPESYWNGSDGTGNFTSGTLVFYNDYNPDWFSWSGWAYSNMADNTTPGYTNQYSAFSPVRIDSAEGKNYGLTYTSPFSQVNTALDCDQYFPGFFINNSTYAALSMKMGDAYTKKFGGDDGTDPDWLKLTIRGNRNDGTHDTVSFYLADYRFEDPADDYIIETWQWVDLTPLGKVHTLGFTLSSTDNGDWGMNTPAYFCMDNLCAIPDIAPELLNPVQDQSGEPGQTLKFDLKDLFTDPDDDDDRFFYQLSDNSWDTLVIDPVVDGDTLRIALLAEGTSRLGMNAISNTKGVYHSFQVNVQTTGLMRQQPGRIRMYPNPSAGFFTVETGNNSPVDVTIYDISGRIVFQQNSFTAGTTIDLSSSPRGTYLAKFRTGNTTYIEKVIKQ